MKKYGVVFAFVVVSVAVWVASASAISSPQVFNLLAVNQSNLPPMNGFEFQRPPQPGDQINIGDTLYGWAGTKRGAKVGSDRGIITFMSVVRTAGWLPQRSVLPSRRIGRRAGILHFPGRGPEKFTLPVVGGTGKYNNVRGYINFRDLGDGNQNKANMELHLLP